MSNKQKILFWIGAFLMLDGIVSFLFFMNEATILQQAVRVFRAGIGLFLMRWMK